MIYEAAAITELIKSYRDTSNPETLKEIILLHVPLAEVIASKFPSQYREDLIQELLKQVPYIVDKFTIGKNLHNYVTTAFTNTCRSVTNSKRLRRETDFVFEEVVEHPREDSYDKEHILKLAIEHNRQRFPSLDIDAIDAATKYCVTALYENTEKKRGIVKLLMNVCNFQRPVATVVYHSTLVYLRTLYQEFTVVYIDYDEDSNEFTLLPELEKLLGQKLFDQMMVLFAGFNIKIPS